jgi:hypothetical protein
MANIIAYDPVNPHLGGNIRGGDPNTWCPELWDYLISAFNPKTLCDVGCGEGYLIEYFQKKGITVRGIDGLPDNKYNSPVAVRDKIIIHDYQNKQPEILFYDMVISCEFVEHVDEIYSINYLDQFKECKHLAFTHAVPDQPGHNHVNCKDDKYWIAVMKALGFEVIPVITAMARKLAGATFWNTVLIFKNTAL